MLICKYWYFTQSKYLIFCRMIPKTSSQFLVAKYNSKWRISKLILPFTSFTAFPFQKRINWIDLSRIWGSPDSSMVFPRAEKKAISRWKYPREMKILSNVRFFPTWICICNFAIARLYVTEIFSFWISDGILNDHLLIVSAFWD